jgi:hypothetical protein
MNASELLIWGLVVHLVVDWLFQNEWQAVNKVRLTHPAAYVHAGMHGAAQLLVFPWWAALAVGVTHLLIDTRKPVEWWSKLIRQTQPRGTASMVPLPGWDLVNWTRMEPVNIVDLGLFVRFWSDQVWHIGVVALLALVAA